MKRPQFVIRNLFILGLMISLIIGCGTGKVGSATKSIDQSIYIVQIPPANMLEQLKNNEIDGFVSWEPFNATAVKGGYGRYLIKSEQIWANHPCCVLATRDSIKDENVLLALTWANVKAIAFINNPANLQKVQQYAAEFTSKPLEVVTKALPLVKYVDFPDQKEFTRFNEMLKQDKLLTKDFQDLGYQSQDALWQTFLDNKDVLEVKEKLKQNPNWVPPSVSETTLRIGYITQDLHQLALYVAVKEGYYKEIGLVPGNNLVQKSYANGVAVMQAFANRELDASYLGGAPATLKRINDNVGIKIIGGANDEGSALVVAKDGKIQNVQELAGKTIAVPGIGTVQYVLLQSIADQVQLKIIIK